MNTFITLLRKHKDDLEREHSASLNHDIRRAINAMLTCKTAQQGHS